MFACGVSDIRVQGCSCVCGGAGVQGSKTCTTNEGIIYLSANKDGEKKDGGRAERACNHMKGRFGCG